ncbi:DEAD/DEAH box helicase [Pseudotabrizicola formosa]|uniref:DEAD/DEAH box helicase n=1 Tax=Pseudotabrizicola formosa TaxID=2030009 RepID=UPI000CD02879|nr:DEAD/DEAH box helicase [Pseudotabrizicola formosa]
MIDVNVAAPLAQALEAKGYEALTAVQMAVLADGVEGRDLLVSAQTGSGKTVAFGLAIAPEILAGSDRLLYADKPIALVVAPTRELALQVKRELDWLYGVAGAQIASCVGGMDYRTEKRVLDRGTHIVVGTPGRLRDHIERGSLDLSFCRATVLDEADEMLDLGFAEDLEFILGAAPQDRRTLMFSATVPKEIETLARTFQRDAMRIIAKGETKQHADIEYRAMSVASRDREHAIFNTLRYYDAPTAIVFCKTRMNVTHLMARMTNRGFQAVALSGELSQQERTHALQSLRDGRARVCIATDVAARGIDLPGLELVIHADLPSNSDTLLHRSGRTGRAGAKGVSALIVPPAEAKKAQRLLAGAKVVAQWVKAPSAEEVQAKDDQRILEHPALTEAVGDEAAMVSTLIERFGAEQTAAAFIRLWREGRSAPEVLSDSLPPPPASAPRERSEFGPSVWFTLTVGHSGRAEARWILPKICDGAGISKDGIGAIRVKEDVTYVQIAEPLAGRFGPQLELEPGLTMSRMEGEPSLDRPERAPRPAPREDRPAYKPKPSRVVEDDAIIAAPAPARKPYAKRDDAERKPYTPREDKPYAPRAAAERKPYAPRDGAERKPYAKREDGDRKPYAPRDGAERKPYVKREDGPAGGAKFKSAGYKSFGGSDGKPARAAGFKSHAAEGTGYKPKAEGDRAEKRTYAPKGDDARPYAKRDGKPAGKPSGFKAGGDAKKPFARKSDAPARPRADAKDTSKRFVPPKGAKR